MPLLWIVDLDPRRLTALIRLAVAPESAIRGAPGDPLFDSAPAPDVVLLGLSEDPEAELEFAHRNRLRLRDARWILLPTPGTLERTRRLFDTLGVERGSLHVLAYPPEATRLRELLLKSPPTGSAAPLPLSRRPARDALRERFALWLSDLEREDLMRALDPRRADLPLQIRGEAGTGRALLVRYVDAFGARSGAALAHVVCSEDTRSADIHEAVRAAREGRAAPAALSIWLADADRLPVEVQHQIAGWSEFGLPDGARPRWLASGRDALAPALSRALGPLCVTLPPLRETPERIARFAAAVAQHWCAAHGERARSFSADAVAALEEYPWPGNLRELEGVVVETLLFSAADPLAAEDLQHEGLPFAPLDASAVGTLVEAGEPDAANEPAPTPPTEKSAPVAQATPDVARGGSASNGSLRNLVGALAHEVRNPLSSIRTFAELLTDRFDDPEFRTRFAETVGDDIRRIEHVVERLGQMASLEPPESGTVDLERLLDELLDEQSLSIRNRRLVVLKELDIEGSLVLGDEEQLRFAFEALLNRSVQLVPEGGSVYLATRQHAAGLNGLPSVRVLMRYQGPAPARRVKGMSPEETSLEFALAEAIVRAHNGGFAVEAGESGETVILADLPAPAA